MASLRSRVWVFVAYPDSVPDNWEQIINQNHLQWAHSPLHDADVNGDGTEKKAHWHIFIKFDGVKSYEQVSCISQSVNATIPQHCVSPKGTIRYFCHLDNPEKAQYNTTDIVAFGGLDVAEMLKPTSGERYEYIAEMVDFVENNGIIEFKDLFNYARIERFNDWFPLLCDNSAYILNQYIRSQRHSAIREYEEKHRR